MDLEKSGKKIDEIKVQISYKIIELFSAGLYSSPNKAFEELVSNSYDAMAKNVSVYVPSSISEKSSYLWVADDGISMDLEGLKRLWRIGYSNKRDLNIQRLQIGKFGIGKLSTYILANKLTYICKNENDYLAVTMDYSKITEEDAGITENEDILTLDVRKLEIDQVKEILERYIFIESKYLLNFKLWGKNGTKSWTFCIMNELKTKAEEISEGRLKWVLRTALPLNPNFKLLYNGNKIEPSKIDIEPEKTWIIGHHDSTAEKYYEIGKNDGEIPTVNFSHLKNVHGQFVFYKDSLVTGKSENLGRSHGIFLMVRGRLINSDDPLLGMDAFTHGTFNRTRIVINADELDEHITSTRESIKESKAFSELKEYIKRKFNNEVREYHISLQQEREKEQNAFYKLKSSPTSLSRRPLLVLARKYFRHDISSPLLTKLPLNLDEEQEKKFVQELEDDLTSDEGIIKKVEAELLGPEFPIGMLDLETRTIKVNYMHPFFANYSEVIKSYLPFQLVAITEILTEAQLVEIGLDQEEIRKIMIRRDQTLRELTYSNRPNAPLIATMIHDALAHSRGLEKALYEAFRSLGYDTTDLAKKGQPDGKAVALLGFRGNKINATYSLVYDAKSTKHDRVSNNDANISSAVRHRKDYEADYAVIIGRDFQGADDSDSAISKEAKQHKVTLIRANDLIRLLLLSAPKQVGLNELEDLFKNCHTVSETSEWIKNLKEKKISRGPIKDLLETIYDLQKEDTEVPVLAALRMANPELKKLSIDEIRSLVLSLHRLVPELVSLNDDQVSINNPPDKILKSIDHITSTEIPPEFSDLYLKAFE